MDVFATETEAHNAAQEAFDQWRVADEPYELDGWVVLGKASELACLLSLQCLCDPYRWFASSLHALEVGDGDGARAQWYCEVIGRGDGVGDGVVHPAAPAGDIAWAASPMHNRPGSHQRLNRLERTDSSLIWSQSVSAARPAAKNGAARATRSRKAASPAA
ncbi:hypothetical protein AHiyo8_24020 [Arthrobacter sp. Hiyo8]|nr:hypothetical protein AHiyo8_24020 [Arthrobacter sp. Hiyo8]